MISKTRSGVLLALLVALLGAAPALTGQNYAPAPDLDPLHVPFDGLLDLNVRDGLVYYRALQGSSASLNRYIASLNSPAVTQAYESWDKPRQMAFWINAYDAFVLQTVIAHYPIRGQSKEYPTGSIRQIPGAFERTKHMAAGRSVTLDQIETTILGAFNDPRVYLVLGRGAMGSGRLRSEAFSGASLERQLAQSAQQFATIPRYVRVDASAGKVSVNPLLSWRGKELTAEYAGKSFDLPKRTPLELAIVGFIRPHLLEPEADFIKKNTFQLDYLPFDWRLNDLTGR
jgi:Protein of unknown function, DUF547